MVVPQGDSTVGLFHSWKNSTLTGVAQQLSPSSGDYIHAIFSLPALMNSMAALMSTRRSWMGTLLASC
jgi:hypothetical protein